MIDFPLAKDAAAEVDPIKCAVRESAVRASDYLETNFIGDNLSLERHLLMQVTLNSVILTTEVSPIRKDVSNVPIPKVWDIWDVWDV